MPYAVKPRQEAHAFCKRLHKLDVGSDAAFANTVNVTEHLNIGIIFPLIGMFQRCLYATQPDCLGRPSLTVDRDASRISE